MIVERVESEGLAHSSYFVGSGSTAVVLVFVILFHKELVYLTFDQQSARLSGIPVLRFEFAFNVLVALTVVVSIKIVGTLLVSALLITPAASAMQFSHSFRRTLLAVIVIGCSRSSSACSCRSRLTSLAAERSC